MPDQPPTAAWQQQLDTLLSQLNDADASADAALAASLSGLDPALAAFLIQQIGEQGTPEAAAFLEIAAARDDLPAEAHAQARAALTQLAERGVAASAPEQDRFLAGYIQQGRESGEQILLLGWRIPSGEIEALVFLLNWRGDGWRDYYATHTLSDAQWAELIEHNAKKGAPLAELPLAEAHALLDAAHPARAGRTPAEAVEALRIELKHAPRREEEVETVPADVPAHGKDRSVLDATSVEVAVQPSGKRTRSEVRERYTLRLTGDGWRIARIERLS
jgi:hypothetical protein